MEDTLVKPHIAAPLFLVRARNRINILRDEIIENVNGLHASVSFHEEDTPTTMKDLEEMADLCHEIADAVQGTVADTCDDVDELLAAAQLEESFDQIVRCTCVTVHVRSTNTATTPSDWSMVIIDSVGSVAKLAFSIFNHLKRNLPPGAPATLPEVAEDPLVLLQKILAALGPNEKGVSYSISITRKATFCPFAD